ncbi:MAG TPA: histidine--tRNA ligase [Flavobacteriales bacterium]|nr:histidine--tRNA ligase [Flavobacteriales bacterium]
MANKPSIPKGTRDFLPEQSLKRQFIFDTARSIFQLYGYQPIETPAMENLETLTGKYGDEGDKLIYKIQSGKNLREQLGEEKTVALDAVYPDWLPQKSDRALRYDLTVPFARFVVQNQNELSFPFKRFQIQPVWRGDRPQRGRYREFYQCDVDVIGSNGLLNEAELLCIVSEVFENLGLGDIQIRLNNRKILSGIANVAGLGNYFSEMTVAIDKLDKIGVEGVKKEMIARGLPAQGVKKALDHISRKADSETVLRMLSGSLIGDEEGQRGIDEMRKTLRALPEVVREKVEIDLTLARGLNYYTGAIIEVGHEKFPSSICGGGRYDDLTGIFGLKDVSGVGVSFGADRIYDLMEDLDLFPKTLSASSDVLFINFGEKESLACMELAMKLRSDKFSAEVYPDAAKMQKQMKYANSRGFRFVILIGSQEMDDKSATVKEMNTGDQQSVRFDDLNKFVFDKLGAE